LRGLSILLVLTAHVYTPGWKDIGSHQGVVIFFVLSGFLITRLLIHEESQTGTVDLLAFYLRRVFRLFPLYYLVLAVYCLLIIGLNLTTPDGRAGFIQVLPYYLFYFQEIPNFSQQVVSPGAIPFYQSWSLGIEEKFYLLWPFFGFLVCTRIRGRILYGLIFACTLAPFLWPWGQLIYSYAAIGVGCLLALREADSRAASVPAVDSGFVLLTLLLLGFLHLVALDNYGWPTRVADALYPFLVAQLIVCALRHETLGRILSWRPLRVLGELSYGIYLIHLLCRNAAEIVIRKAGLPTDSGILRLFVMLAFSLALAWPLNRFFENPIRVYGRELVSRRRLAGADARTP
jgi:peptidoglycan/LPS O-acetylase OafA/YrhL